jgi:pyridoxal phosphate enzyme (YggS family)
MASSFSDVEYNYQHICENIARAAQSVGKTADDITFLAATKTVDASIINHAISLGLRYIGENRVQEGLAKAPLCPSAEWHLIGPLQRNKIRHALSLFTVLHGIDSEPLLHDLARVQDETGARPDVMLEVNVADEPTKHGFTPAAVRDALRAALADGVLRVVGLMCIPPFVTDPEQSRPRFRALRELRDALQDEFSLALPQLSMGMSGDFEVAIEEGATYVRVGTALFGRRTAGAWKPERSPDSDSYFV